MDTSMENNDNISLIIEEMPKFFPEYLFNDEKKKIINNNVYNNINNNNNINIIPFKSPIINKNSMFFFNKNIQQSQQIQQSVQRKQNLQNQVSRVSQQGPRQFNQRKNKSMNFTF